MRIIMRDQVGTAVPGASRRFSRFPSVANKYVVLLFIIARANLIRSALPLLYSKTAKPLSSLDIQAAVEGTKLKLVGRSVGTSASDRRDAKRIARRRNECGPLLLLPLYYSTTSTTMTNFTTIPTLLQLPI